MAELRDYRCVMQDCRALLFRGNFTGTVQHKCKCGILNTFDTAGNNTTIQAASKGRSKPYQDRMGLTKK